MNHRLYKRDRLCSRTAIETLFAAGRSLMAFPLRAMMRVTDDHAGARFLISIPKKRIRTAVGRVRLRRQVREAYRLNHREALEAVLAGEDAAVGVDIAFIYIDNKPAPYAQVELSVKRLLERVARAVTEHRASMTGNSNPDNNEDHR